MLKMVSIAALLLLLAVGCGYRAFDQLFKPRPDFCWQVQGG